MSSQQFPRTGVPPPTLGPAPPISTSGPAGLINPATTVVSDEPNRELEVTPRDHVVPASSLQSREEKQETVVVRPYPQVQMLTQHHTVPSGVPVTVAAPPTHLAPAVPLTFPEGLIKPPLKPAIPSRPIAPAPPAPPSTLSGPTKVPGQVTVTMESSIPQASAIPVATISGQQGHPNSVHHIMTTNVQMSIIRSSAPGPPLHIGASHLPRGAAAAAVMSSSKVTTVLRPASQLPNAATAQSAVQHIIHQPIQSRPAVTTSSTIPPAVVATVSATRAQSPVITTTTTHATESTLSRPALSIQQHPPSAPISIQRPAQPRDTATRITLPSHPAIGTQKQLHNMAQKTIFSTGTPVAAATVAPILATNTIPSVTTTGSISHTQAATSTIVTVTMPSHSSHATAVTTSNIPVAKVVPQQITHTPPRIQSDYTAERSNLIPISGHRASPNPVAMEARNDNRQSVPVQFQYFLPTYPPSYPLAAHTYTPITSSVSTIRQYPVSAQAPNSAIAAQTGVGVASTVHLNPMQLMTVDASHARHIQGIQSTPIGAQGIQPAPISAQGIQSTPIGTQGLHPAAPIGTQGLQTAPLGPPQPQTETKTSVVLADGATIMANPISNTFNSASASTTVVQTHSQSANSSTSAQGSSPRPSILRKKPTTDGLAVRKSLIPPQPTEVAGPRVESSVRSASGSPRPAGVKPKPEIHVSMATPVTVSVEAVSIQSNEQPPVSVPTSQQPQSAIPTIITAASPPLQPTTALSSIPGTLPAPPPTSATVVTVPPPPSTISGILSTVLGPVVPEIKIKEEVEPLDIMRPVSAVPPLSTNSVSPSVTLLANNLTVPQSDLPPGASPRKKPHEEGVRYVPVRPRPPITLLRHYRNPWKAAYHHFQRYSDVRVKEEKKAMLQEIANQKGVSCRAQGWKVHLCAAQLLQLTNLEHDVYERLTSLQEGIIPKKKAATDDDLHQINELIQGNMQRCKLVMDQINEARESMLKVLDHKERVLKLLNKNGTVKKVSKLKRKEKV
ncbi:histone deacetylase complex subunit SAP130 isoform X6 [Pseudonaja textilis]|uniref:histone deacetylase complex subunit SAP130 isoform X6 n=1 Tax=Pseudonaja textilis TaxID=8673 RepID=UPI000EA8F4FD|nr:histone deacetylase complex subunit SAP130 isoform X6 [Pseudonaja textilis]